MGFYLNRISKLRSGLKNKNIDAALIIPGPNLRYFTGFKVEAFERLLTLIIPTYSSELSLITPMLEYERAKALGIEGLSIIGYRDDEDPYEILVKRLKDAGAEVVGVEGFMPFRTVSKLLKAGFRLTEVDDLVYSMRITKDTYEVELMRRASRIDEEAIKEGFRNLKSGLTEKEVSRIVREKAEELGAEEVPFCVVQSGPNTALPHAESSSRRIEVGDVVLFDVGVRVEGYFADITRTVVLGEPKPEHMKIYNIVKEAQERAIKAVKPGVTAESIDATARNIIEESGYGEYFIHRTGHGLGLEVHEEPYIRAGNKMVLKEGMAFTVEPGIYLPGKFGVRIEDDIVVTKDGFEDLTKLSKSLTDIS